MAFVKLNNGSTQEVDDDELKSLIAAGAGQEVDAPNPAPAGAQVVTNPDGSMFSIDTVVKGKNRSLPAMEQEALQQPLPPDDPNLAQQAYQGARNVLSVPLAATEAVGRSVLNTVTNPIMGSEGGTNVVQNFKDAWAGRNEGLRGMGNDPLNVGLMAANFIPGAGIITDPIEAARLGKYGSLAAGVVRDAALGAGTGAAQSYLDPNSQETIGEGAGMGAALGGTGALAGGLLRNWGVSAIPGLGKKYNLKIPEASKELYRQNASPFLAQGFLPMGREGFLQRAEELQHGAVEGPNGYEAGMNALEAAQPNLQFSMPDWQARASQELENNLAQYHEPGLETEDTPKGFTIPAAAQQILDQKFGAIQATKLANTPRPWAFPGSEAYWDPDQAIARNAEIASQLSPREFSLARSGATDPVVFQNQDAEVARMKRKAGQAIHSTANDMLMEHPEYAATLGAPAPTNQIFANGNAPQRFKLGSTIEDLTNSPGAIGLAHRLHLGPLNPAMDPWLWASGAYKLGQAVDQAGIVPVGMGLYNAYRALTGGIPIRDQGQAGQ